jgi:hypothetical protein
MFIVAQEWDKVKAFFQTNFREHKFGTNVLTKYEQMVARTGR